MTKYFPNQITVVFVDLDLTPGHADHLPVPQASTYWHPIEEGACKASWPQN